jgi:methylase of polypeptide subunit release factors
MAYEVGIGTGVLTAVLLQRGVQHVVGTDVNPRAVACARDNLTRLQLMHRVTLLEADLFPPPEIEAEVVADLVVCNPPWLPLQPHSLLDMGVYDHHSDMLRSLLLRVRHHLRPDSGQCFLLLSDLAERLGLRTRQELLDMVEAGGLMVVDRMDTPAVHSRGMFSHVCMLCLSVCTIYSACM